MRTHYHDKRVHEIANRMAPTGPGCLDDFESRPSQHLPIVAHEYPGPMKRALIPPNPNLRHMENYKAFMRQPRRLIADAISD